MRDQIQGIDGNNVPLYKQQYDEAMATKAAHLLLISVSDGISQVLWTKYFLECQGYEVNSSTIYQDNEASILLERNGKRSSKKGTRHINIRYFFITDKVQNGEVDIEYMLYLLWL